MVYVFWEFRFSLKSYLARTEMLLHASALPARPRLGKRRILSQEERFGDSYYHQGDLHFLYGTSVFHIFQQRKERKENKLHPFL